MNIALTNDAKTLAGGENYLLYLANGLREKGHKVLIAPMLDSALANIAREQKFEVFEVNYGHGGKEFKAIKQLYSYLKEKKIDIVQSNSTLDRTISAVVGRMIHAKNFAVLPSSLSISHNITHKIRNKYLIDHFIPVGHSTIRILVHSDGIDEKKITVIHVGLPDTQFLYSETDRAEIRKEFKIADKEIVIGTISRLVYFKGHTYLLKAFKQLADIIPNIKLLIVGDGDLESKLKSEAAELNIADKTFFAGYRTDISKVLSAMDIFTLTSTNEGGESCPLAMLSAMSVGLPLVASDVGDIKYMVTKDNGFLIESMEINQIAMSLKLLIESDEMRKIFGQISRKIFLERFSQKIMVEKTEQLYFRELNRL
jgi:glycosyltransferase involved in cell wall biosynthesis